MREGKKPSPALVKLDNNLFKAMKAVSVVSMASLLVIALLSTADVVGMKIFSKGITNATDLVTYLNIPVVFLSTAFVQLERGHVHIDLIYTRFPQPVQKLIHTLGNLLGAGISLFIGYRAVINTLSKLESTAKSSSAASAFVIWPFAAVIAIGFLLLALAFVWSIVRELFLPPREMPLPGMNGEPAQVQETDKGEV